MTNSNEAKHEVQVTVPKMFLKRLFSPPNRICNKSTSNLVNMCTIFSGKIYF